jgi:hypothetical protein
MISDSRKAQRDNFAHHRAALLFSNKLASKDGPGEWFASIHEGVEPKSGDALQRLKANVRAGLHGFLPLASAR